MINFIKGKVISRRTKQKNRGKAPDDYKEYMDCIGDLLSNQDVLRMEQFRHHKNMTCLDHCLHVSYTTYRICKFFSWDYHSAARGALLHDLFLYDWHLTRPERGLHAFVHARIAWENAVRNFELNALEQDIIKKHMWPVTWEPPRYKESLIVTCTDKYCALMEVMRSEIKSIRPILDGLIS